MRDLPSELSRISLNGICAMPLPMTRQQANTVATWIAVLIVTDLPAADVNHPAISRQNGSLRA
jgi:hypothetical protein